ncbi:MAG: B12-binding domain-containing radical SAM protein [Deltaproteobacteria bacterium]|nr:B12-binding domain-containing radical SAM protein [Deltaproteobacteria bacterium]
MSLSKIKKVLLIVPPAEFGYGYINRYFWQYGVLQLASYLLRQLAGRVQVTICDGNIRNYAECFSAMKEDKYDLYGFHCVDHTRSNALSLASQALDSGVDVIFGGAGPTLGPKQYLEPFRDDMRENLVACCIGPGEQCLHAILEGTAPCKTPNLIYIDKGKIVASGKTTNAPSSKHCYLNKQPWWVYQAELKRYINHQLRCADFPYPPVTFSTMSHEGCIHRRKISTGTHNGCNFCGIPAAHFVPRDPRRIWDDLITFDSLAREESAQVCSVKDWGDSVTAEILQGLIDTRPPMYKNINYSCYLSIRDVNDHTLELLRRLNCFSVYVGIDGTSDRSLRWLRKGYTSAQTWSALEKIRRTGIKIEVGLILGVAEENPETLQYSLELSRQIVEMFKENVIVVQGNVLIPMPGSPTFSQFQRYLISKENTDPLFLDIENRIRSWLNLFTDVNYETVITVQKAIEAISPRRHNYATRSEQSP